MKPAHKVLLVVLDGWGLRAERESNAILLQGTPHLDRLTQGLPFTPLQTSGLAEESVRNLRANGTFAASEIQMSPESAFETMSGRFNLSFASNWPDLRLSDIVASQADGDWTGQGASKSDGTLAIDLEREDRQLHLVGFLLPQPRVAETRLPRRSPQQ